MPDLPTTMGLATAIHNYRFGEFELQPHERRLLRDGKSLDVGPRCFDVLTLLVQRAGSLVTKEEILERVWPRVVVEENALQAQISAIRRLIGKDSIETVSKRGYRFALQAERLAGAEGAPAKPWHNLPHPLTSFIGREAPLQELERLLGRSRLVTLTGAGGCGKTRLAIQAAARVLPVFPDGCWMVDLSSLTDPGSVIHAVASALGVKAPPSETLLVTLSSHLRDKRALLLVDNVEHLLDTSATLIDQLLAHAPQVVTLATGREPLRLSGEVVYRVPSLTLPEAGSRPDLDALLGFESVRLFVDRVRLHQVHFTATVQDIPDLVSICRQLDGIPLALELAAARVRSMSVAGLARRLDQQLSLLQAGYRNAVPRHATLRALIDWSYGQLDMAERVLLCRLCVFSGGFDLAAAEAVCGDASLGKAPVLNLLDTLVDKSLVHAKDDDGATRYALLETVRQYGIEQLTLQGDLVGGQERHLAHFVRVAEDADPTIEGPEQKGALDRLELNHDNFRAALSLCLANPSRHTKGLRIAVALRRLWQTRGHVAEGYDWLARLLAPPPTQPDAVRGTALLVFASLAGHRGERELEQAVAEEALNIGRTLANDQIMCGALRTLAELLRRKKHWKESQALQMEALGLARRAGDMKEIGLMLNSIALHALDAKDHSPAVGALILEGCDIMEKLGDRSRYALSVLTYSVFLYKSDPLRSLSWNLRALHLFHELHNDLRAADCFDRLAYLALVNLLVDRGGTFFGASDAVRERTGAKRAFPIEFSVITGIAVSDARTEVFDAAMRRGRLMCFDDAWAYAHDSQFPIELEAARNVDTPEKSALPEFDG